MQEKELVSSLEKWISAHKEEMVQDIIRMVNCKSVSEPKEGGYAFGFGCKACADEMAGLGERYGFLFENDDYYTLSVLMPGETTRELGILGHLDVVPEGEGWHYKPYNAIEKDGFVIGRGSEDNKGAVIMSLYVMRFLKEMGVGLRHTLRLICGFNEESGMKDVEHYLACHDAPEFTLVCDCGWAMCIGEKGILNADLTQSVKEGNLAVFQGGAMSNAVPGFARAVVTNVDTEQVRRFAEECSDAIEVVSLSEGTEIRARGRAAHAAFPEGGKNAISLLARFLSKYGILTGEAHTAVKNLAGLFPDEYGTGLGISFADQMGKTTCVGSMVSLRDHKLVQHIDVRYAIRQDGEELVDRLKAACREKNVTVENLECSAPRYSDPDTPVIRMLLDTCHEFLGKEYNAYTMGGGTHARKFPNALPYGPGGVKLAVPNPYGSPHGIDEAVSIEGLIRSMYVYAAAVLRLDRML